MHYIASILAVSIFVLSLLPCTDGGEHIDGCTDHFEAHSQSHDHEGDCPPFCTCNCCGVVIGSVPVYDATEEIFINPATFVTEFHYSFHYSHQHPTNIWQPPTRLV